MIRILIRTLIRISISFGDVIGVVFFMCVCVFCFQNPFINRVRMVITLINKVQAIPIPIRFHVPYANEEAHTTMNRLIHVRLLIHTVNNSLMSIFYNPPLVLLLLLLNRIPIHRRHSIPQPIQPPHHRKMKWKLRVVVVGDGLNHRKFFHYLMLLRLLLPLLLLLILLPHPILLPILLLPPQPILLLLLRRRLIPIIHR